MELKEYIKAVMTDISDAVTEINSTNKSCGNGITVCPKGAVSLNNLTGTGFNAGTNTPSVTTIKFKVVICSEKNSEKGGGFQLAVSLLKAGASARNINASSEENTIEFSLPVEFKHKK